MQATLRYLLLFCITFIFAHETESLTSYNNPKNTVTLDLGSDSVEELRRGGFHRSYYRPTYTTHTVVYHKPTYHTYYSGGHIVVVPSYGYYSYYNYSYN